jgi:hypothetical protein
LSRSPARPTLSTCHTGRTPKLWGRRGHAAVDYATAPALYLLARYVGLQGTALRWVDRFVLLILLAVFTTRTPLGLIQVVPFRFHGRAEQASIAVQLALPWTAHFSRDRRARDFFLIFAAYNFLVWQATDWDAEDD